MLILLALLGVPIPIIILLAMFWREVFGQRARQAALAGAAERRLRIARKKLGRVLEDRDAP
jgi:hypothetical protein